MHQISQRYVPPAYYPPPPYYPPPQGEGPPPSYTAEAADHMQYRSDPTRAPYPHEPPPPYPGSNEDEYNPPAQLPSYPHDVQTLRCPSPIIGLNTGRYSSIENFNRERPVRTDLAHRSCHVVFLKGIATPFTFLGGTLLWAIYGFFRGIFTGISEARDLIDDSQCEIWTKVLLAPCLVYLAIGAVYRNVVLGLIAGGIFGGYVSCNSLWNNEPIVFYPQEYFRIPMLNSIYHRAISR